MNALKEIQSVPPSSHPNTVLAPNGPHLYPLPPPSSPLGTAGLLLLWLLTLSIYSTVHIAHAGHIFGVCIYECIAVTACSVSARSSIAQVCEEVQFVWLLGPCGRGRDKKVRI